MILSILALVGGVAILTAAAEKAVAAAEELSAHLGISPLIVGALVVGLGTSLPEMVVSGIAAAQRDTIDLAVGNVVGSNAANLTLVLGVGTLICTVKDQSSVMRREGLLMVSATALFTVLAYNGTLSQLEAAILLAGMVVAAGIVVTGSGDGLHELADPTPPQHAKHVGVDRYTEAVPTSEVRSSVFWAVAGLVGVLIGAQLMVTGAVDIASEFGASEAFIGLTVVAVGTSLPELATTVVSARRNSMDLVIGNLVGSNIFNSLAVGGVAGMLGTGVIEESINRSMLIMLGVAVATVAWGATGKPAGKAAGILLLTVYVALVAAGA